MCVLSTTVVIEICGTAAIFLFIEARCVTPLLVVYGVTCSCYGILSFFYCAAWVSLKEANCLLAMCGMRWSSSKSAFHGYSVKCEFHNRIGIPEPKGFTYIKLNAEAVYYCDGDRVRCESNAESQSKGGGKATNRKETVVSDGTVVKAAEGKGNGQQGVISSQQNEVFFQGFNPRNFMSRIQGLPAKVYLTGEKSSRLVGEVTRDGRRLLLLETEPIASGGKEWITRVYVDPKRNYQIRETSFLFRFEKLTDAKWIECGTTRMSSYQ